MVWGCFAASGPGWLAIIDGTMNSALYQKTLKKNIRPLVCDLKLKRTWLMQQDNDPKHTSKSKKHKIKVLEWPSQSPDLNPIEMLLHDLKQSIHAWKPSNVAELKQFCKEEWAKIHNIMAEEILERLYNHIQRETFQTCAQASPQRQALVKRAQKQIRWRGASVEQQLISWPERTGGHVRV